MYFHKYFMSQYIGYIEVPSANKLAFEIITVECWFTFLGSNSITGE